VTRADFLRGAGRTVALAPFVLLAACGGDDQPSRAADTAGTGDAADPRVFVRAAAAGDTAAVRRLLAAGADVDGRTAAGRTAVTAAALGDHV
jgi:hypothetical protein